MLKNNPKFQRGVLIIEGLIAVTVFALGALALTHYQGEINQEAGLVKAQETATLLAQEKIEEFRGVPDKAAYDGLGDDSDPATISMGNAEFSRSWTVSEIAGTNSKLINVTVSWTSAEGVAESVTIGGVVTWHAPALEVAAPGNVYTPIPHPTGDSVLDPDTELTEEQLADAVEVIPDDGLMILVDEEEEKTYLIDELTGEVLFEVLNTNGLVRLRGYVQWVEVTKVKKNGKIQVISTPSTPDDAWYNDATYTVAGVDYISNVQVLTSDNSYCVPEDVLPYYMDPVEDEDKHFYHCYVSSNWYGNIGAVGFVPDDSLCPPQISYPPVIRDHPEIENNNLGPDGQWLWSVQNQNFGIVKNTGGDECAAVTLEPYLTPSLDFVIEGQIELVGGLTSDQMEDNLVVATANTICDLIPITDTTMSYVCTITGSFETPWGGHIVAYPAGEGSDPQTDVCGENVYYWPDGTELPTIVYDGATDTFYAEPEVIDPLDFTLTFAPRGSCVLEGEPAPQYEHTVVITATSASIDGVQADRNADQLEFVEGGYVKRCALAVGNAINAVYHCSVVAPPDTSVEINYSLAGDYALTPSFTTVTTYATTVEWEDAGYRLVVDTPVIITDTL